MNMASGSKRSYLSKRCIWKHFDRYAFNCNDVRTRFFSSSVYEIDFWFRHRPYSAKFHNEVVSCNVDWRFDLMCSAPEDRKWTAHPTRPFRPSNFLAESTSKCMSSRYFQYIATLIDYFRCIWSWVKASPPKTQTFRLWVWHWLTQSAFSGCHDFWRVVNVHYSYFNLDSTKRIQKNTSRMVLTGL